jgi:hypothetical protein
MQDIFGSILHVRFGILIIFFAHDTLILSRTISAINYIGFGFIKPNTHLTPSPPPIHVI